MQLGLTLHAWQHSNDSDRLVLELPAGGSPACVISHMSPVLEIRLRIEEQLERHADKARSAHLPSPAQAQKVPPLLCSRRTRGRFGNTTTQLLPLDNPKHVPQDG